MLQHEETFSLNFSVVAEIYLANIYSGSWVAVGHLAKVQDKMCCHVCKLEDFSRKANVTVL